MLRAAAQKSEINADLNLAKTEGIIRLRPLYTAVQQAAKTGDRAAFEAAKEQYIQACALERAKYEAEKARVQSRVNAIDDEVRQAVSGAEDQLSSFKASGDDGILSLESAGSPQGTGESIQPDGVLDGLQIALDVAGLIPGFGEVADGLNALISLIRGDYVGAGLSLAAMIPFAGWAATVGKAGKYAIEGANVLGTVAKYGDEAIDAVEAVAKHADEVANVGETILRDTDDFVGGVGRVAEDLVEGTEEVAGELVEGAGDILPKVEEVTVDTRKVTEYALNSNNTSGGAHKARVFESALGYNKSNSNHLIQQIESKLSTSKAILGKADKYGQRFTVDMPITGPNGITAIVRTGWILESGSDVPRMTTIFVK